jgi:hypothetical protein
MAILLLAMSRRSRNRQRPVEARGLIAIDQATKRGNSRSARGRSAPFRPHPDVDTDGRTPAWTLPP